MIHTIRTVAVGDQESKIDSPIILYRGDREVEVEFTINGSKFTFTNGGNVIKSTNATHGQLVINTPTGENMFSEVTECHNGKVVFIITKEMIDELVEVGFYSFQIRLFDESQVSRVTIPPVLKGIDIRNPIAAEDETNIVDIGLVDYAVVIKDEFEDLSTFLPDGNYNKTEWESKDVISGAKLNKIEDALYNINSNMEATDLALLNRIENINKNVYGEIDKLGNELESEVEEFERELNNNVERFKIDTNAAMTAHKNEVSGVVDGFSGEIESINSQLAQKANLNTVFSMANMGQDVKEAMTGGSVAVVGRNSILRDNVVDGQIFEEKTSFIDVSVNLFNKNKCLQGFMLNGDSNIDSMTTANRFTWVSNIIKVSPNTQYITNSKSDASRFMCISYMMDGSYDAGITATIDGDGNYIFNTREKTEYIRFTFTTNVLNMDTFMLIKGTSLPSSYVSFYKKLDETLIDDTIKRIERLEGKVDNPVLINGNEISTFNKIVCCGDSLTRGVFNSNNSGFENINYSYPTYLTKLTGVQTENLGNPSYTTKDWYENRKGRDFSSYDCAIIQLGVNDASNSVDDSETLEYLQKIIDKLKTDQPKIKIFIATLTGSKWYNTEKHISKSNAIKQFATGKEAQNIFCVDLKKYSQIYDLPYASGHLTALGYMKQAEEYKNYISYIMRTQHEYFNDIQFIGTEYLPYEG